MVLLFWWRDGEGVKIVCVWGGGREGVWVVPDSEKTTLSTVRNH